MKTFYNFVIILKKKYCNIDSKRKREKKGERNEFFFTSKFLINNYFDWL